MRHGKARALYSPKVFQSLHSPFGLSHRLRLDLHWHPCPCPTNWNSHFSSACALPLQEIYKGGKGRGEGKGNGRFQPYTKVQREDEIKPYSKVQREDEVKPGAEATASLIKQEAQQEVLTSEGAVSWQTSCVKCCQPTVLVPLEEYERYQQLKAWAEAHPLPTTPPRGERSNASSFSPKTLPEHKDLSHLPADIFMANPSP